MRFLFTTKPTYAGAINMRHAAFFLMLLALPTSVPAQLEFLSVQEIFQVINFIAAHPASPVDYRSVSPFGPEADETRMPETFADLAKSILHCYHHTARYQLANVGTNPGGKKEER